MPLERDINIAVNGPFWVEVANQEHPFTAMLISHSRGTCPIKLSSVPGAVCTVQSMNLVFSLVDRQIISGVCQRFVQTDFEQVDSSPGL